LKINLQKLLLQRWITSIADDQSSEYVSDTSSRSRDSNSGSSGTDVPKLIESIKNIELKIELTLQPSQYPCEQHSCAYSEQPTPIELGST
jgi:hypothetical protein